MSALEHLDFLEEYREDNRVEAKRAQGGLPHSLWETYSAFANTLGGVILLGVAESEDKSLYSVPLFDPQELVDEFWSMVRDPAVVSRAHCIFGLHRQIRLRYMVLEQADRTWTMSRSYFNFPCGGPENWRWTGPVYTPLPRSSASPLPPQR